MAKKKTTKKTTAKKAPAKKAEPAKRTNVADLSVGDFLSETQYYEVVGLTDERVKVRNERDYEFSIAHPIVEEGMYSAGQFGEEVKVTRTELCEILENAGDSIFTVNFHKQLNEKDVVEEILAAVEEGKGPRALKTRVNAAVKKGVKGEGRTLIGYLVQVEPKMGRSQVIDLQAPAGRRYRLVDHRTINWLILKNVKYVTK